MLTHSRASGVEVEMPVLGNGAIRGSKKQLHKLEDFLGAVLSKEESEGKRHGRKKFPCCSLLPDSAGLDRVSPANAGRAGYASPSLNLTRNTGMCVGHFREVPSLEPGYWIRSDQISRSVMSNSLRPHESQHTRPPCSSPTPGVH